MSSTTTTSPTGDGQFAGLPADPAALVAAAERATNERDLPAIMVVYAPDAVLESITDGALEVHRGTAELRAAWTTYLTVMAKGEFALRKHVQAVSGRRVANSWEGTLTGHEARGIETWEFNDAGQVRQHVLYSYLKVQSADAPWMQLRLLVSYPETALRFARAKAAGHSVAKGGASASASASAEQIEFIERFQVGWRAGSLSTFLGHFEALVDPRIELEQPPLLAEHGWDGFVRLFTSLFTLIPDVRGELLTWSPTRQGVDLELDLVGTLAGRPVRFKTRDELTLDQGRILKRRAHLDRWALLRAIVRPSVLPTVLRALRGSRAAV